MKVITTLFMFFCLLLSNLSFASEQKDLESSIHNFYHFNIDSNRFWINKTNLKYKTEVEKSWATLQQSMDYLIGQNYSAKEYKVIKARWQKANLFINKHKFIEIGYSDVSLLAVYRGAMNSLRIEMLKRYHQNSPSSDASKLLILFDRIISTYAEINTDPFGGFIRSPNDEDMKTTVIANQIDVMLKKLESTATVSKADLRSIKTKWRFIRQLVVATDKKSVPFIVLLNGRKIISTLEKYNK
jgi:hypothetical protein